MIAEEVPWSRISSECGIPFNRLEEESREIMQSLHKFIPSRPEDNAQQEGTDREKR